MIVLHLTRRHEDIMYITRIIVNEFKYKILYLIHTKNGGKRRVNRNLRQIIFCTHAFLMTYAMHYFTIYKYVKVCINLLGRDVLLQLRMFNSMQYFMCSSVNVIFTFILVGKTLCSLNRALRPLSVQVVW